MLKNKKSLKHLQIYNAKLVFHSFLLIYNIVKEHFMIRIFYPLHAAFKLSPINGGTNRHSASWHCPPPITLANM